MQAVILAGGKGTRLSELFPELPKALVEVAGRPFLQWQLEWLRAGGISDVHLALGVKSDAIENWIQSDPVPGVSVTSSVEPSPLGTGGGLKFTDPFIKGDEFLVLNGDSLMPNLEFSTMYSARSGSNWVASIAVTPVRESGRFGTVEFDEQGRVVAFREKAERTAGSINGGVYLMRRTVLDMIESNAVVSMEHDVFPMLVSRKELFVFQCDPPLLDMGTPDGLAEMSAFLDY